MTHNFCGSKLVLCTSESVHRYCSRRPKLPDLCGRLVSSYSVELSLTLVLHEVKVYLDMPENAVRHSMTLHLHKCSGQHFIVLHSVASGSRCAPMRTKMLYAVSELLLLGLFLSFTATRSLFCALCIQTFSKTNLPDSQLHLSIRSWTIIASSYNSDQALVLSQVSKSRMKSGTITLANVCHEKDSHQ